MPYTDYTEYVTSLSKSERASLKDALVYQEKIEKITAAQSLLNKTYDGPFMDLHPKIIECTDAADYYLMGDITVKLDIGYGYLKTGDCDKTNSWITCTTIDRDHVERFKNLSLPSNIKYQEYRKFCFALLMSCRGNSKWKAVVIENRDGKRAYKLLYSEHDKEKEEDDDLYL